LLGMLAMLIFSVCVMGEELGVLGKAVEACTL
jgi:hypothetical protein